jgi:hypothetical protein
MGQWMNKLIESRTAKVVEIDGEHFLVFPDQLMRQMQWEEGDTLYWSKGPDDSWYVEKMKKES